MSFTGAGTCVIDANQAGNASYNPAPQVRQSISVTTRIATTTQVTADPNSSVFGSTVTFTATVRGSGGTPTGKVTFLDSGVQLGIEDLVNGIATLSTSTLPVGNHTITATYSGDSTFAGSTGTVRESVKRK